MLIWVFMFLVAIMCIFARISRLVEKAECFAPVKRLAQKIG